MQHGDHPRYFARVPGPSNPVGALADALGTGMNVIAASWQGGSGAAAVELAVLEWIRGWCGFPEGSEGVLVSGAVGRSLTALAAARAERGAGVAYVSDQTHASVVRALRILGLPEEDVRVLPSDDDAFRLRPDDLRTALTDDRAAGRTPWCVVATAGTTNTARSTRRRPRRPVRRRGAVAPRRRRLRRAGGAHRPRRRGARGHRARRSPSSIRTSGSSSQNEAGCALVRHPGALGRAFAMSPEYLRDVHEGEVNFRDRGPQLTRGSRALKIWMTVRTFGLDAIREGVARGIVLAERAQRRIEETDGLEVVDAGAARDRDLRGHRRDGQRRPGAARVRRRLRGAEQHGAARPHGPAAVHDQPAHDRRGHRRDDPPDRRARRGRSLTSTGAAGAERAAETFQQHEPPMSTPPPTKTAS